MGASASRIWTEICAIESEYTRMNMVETVLASPDMVYEAKRAGVYGKVLFWLSDSRRGSPTRFPYAYSSASSASARAGTHQIEHAIIVSPAAKALDYFQESLALLGIDESDPCIIILFLF